LKSVATTLLLIHDRRCLGVSPQLQFNGRLISMLVNNLRETPPVSRKKPNVGSSPTGRRETADVKSHVPCRSPAALCRGLEKSLSKRHGRGTTQARHGVCELNTVALCKSYGNDTI
jgi:hypothetical protein